MAGERSSTDALQPHHDESHVATPAEQAGLFWHLVKRAPLNFVAIPEAEVVARRVSA
jgi:hypothetical protein